MLAWPSVVIEVGYPQGMDFLRLDAEWWLINSDDKTRFVILITSETDPFALHIECWMMVESICPTPALIPRCVQDFNIDKEGRVTSTSGSSELKVPSSCIFDEIPDLSPPPAKLSFPELSELALRMRSDIE